MEKSSPSKANAQPATPPDPATPPEGWYPLGTVAGCRGLKGELKVQLNPLHAPIPLTGLKAVWMVVPPKSTAGLPTGRYPVKAWEKNGRGLRLKLPAVPDRTQAEALRGADLWVARAVLCPDPGADYLLEELVGLSVIESETQTPRGQVHDLLSAGDMIYLEIQPPDAEAETVLVPFQPHFIARVDLTVQQLWIQSLAGLFDL